MSDTGDTSLDSRGTFAKPRYINDMQPTTRFHPSELPPDPVAIRQIPAHLIDPNNVTESPGSDSATSDRLNRAEASFMENAHRFGGLDAMKNFLSHLAHPGAANEGIEEAPAAEETGPTEEVPAEPVPAELAPAEPVGAAGQTDAGPTGVPGEEQPAADIPPESETSAPAPE